MGFLTAGLLSALIPGLGQFYNGQIWKAILVHLAMWAAIFLCFFGIGLLLVPIVWIYGIADAMTQD